ncbi:hypothetical protein FSPOR_2239 [Fusarium sporotrichioides]|uniref:Zn(2)-C6 fungal-type domain-containing protein n=1 Tax=Fusarium sporotrichioides TaxID=5514 RepID=A0A395SLE8_FUSSP|nr:hypothetical protein FSPOR_2239 [Fusarium sporotrichioides]
MSSADGHRPKPTTAKWGAACAQCSIAKAKCIRSNNTPGSKCDRCERLVKNCTEQVHRPRKKRTVKPSRTAQIEERLNGLVNLLKAGGLTNADLATDTTCIPTEVDPHVTDQQKPSSKESESSFTFNTQGWSIPDTYNSYAPPQCICRQISGEVPPPPGSDQELLNLYRKEFQALNPFVIIPSGVTAAKLREMRPFLMASIRMVTSNRSLRSMRAQMYHLMKHVADHMLIRSERSLDLLLGIIVIVTWYQYHCFMHAQLNNLIALATTLVGELGLNRSPTVHERTSLMVVIPFQPKARTNEERRALLGVWMAVGFQRIESMRYTKYTQGCLSVLEQEREYETDVRLIALVRIQHLAERISQLNSPEEPAEEVFGFPTAPTSAYVSAFQTELDKIRNGLSLELQNDMLRLYEPPLLDTSRIISMSESLTTPTLGAASALDIFYQSRNALEQFFDHWQSIPISEYHSQTTPIAAQLIYGMTMLGRWTKFTAQIPLTRPPMPMPEDTSAQNPNVELYKADSEHSTSVSPAHATPSATTPSMCENHSQAASPIVLREGTDPRLPAAVAALRLQIQTQPGLHLDVTGILSGIYSKFEEANASVQASSAEPGTSDHNLWSMSAIKVRITRAKLERWVEIVASGTATLKIHDGDIRDTEMEDRRTSEIGRATAAGTTQPGNEIQMDEFGMPDWNEMPLNPDMLLGVDPSIWFDGYLDWGAVMNSMSNNE